MKTGGHHANGPAPATKEVPSMHNKATPGIRERHVRTCPAKALGAREHGAPCGCTPSFEAWVWVPEDGKKLRSTHKTRAAAKGWLVDNRKAARDGRIRVGDSKITVRAWLETWLD